MALSEGTKRQIKGAFEVVVHKRQEDMEAHNLSVYCNLIRAKANVSIDVLSTRLPS